MNKTMGQRRREDETFQSNLERAGELTVTQRRGDWRRYADLLTDQTPSEEKAAELKRLMDTLGRTPEQARQDSANLQRAADAVRRIDAGHGLDDAVQAAERAVMENGEKLRAEIERLKIEHQQLVIASANLSDRQRNARDAVGEIERLKSGSPELLGHVPRYGFNTFAPV